MSAPLRCSALACAVWFCAATAAAQEPHSYSLAARLDPATHTVDGTAHVHFTNTATVPLRELQWHLYLNAFASDETVFMRESRGQLRGVSASDDGRGSITVTQLRVAGGLDLMPAMRTDLLPNDATQMRVALPSPLAPGESIELDLAFRSVLPPIFARAGWAREFHMVAQWFPKLAKLEEDGHWANFPYHGLGEFYSDFADYTLHIDTPAGWVVGASGRLEQEGTVGDRTVRSYRAARVLDVAFVAWPYFEEQRFQASGVDVRVLYPPGHEASVPRHIAATRGGLERFGARYGAYPWDTLTVVLPPGDADGAAGMEYPTLIMSGGPWFEVPGVTYPFPEFVTAHELGHEWFFGTVATDEVTWPMLDEGFTEWISTDYLRATTAPHASSIDTPFVQLDAFEVARISALQPPLTPPPGTPAYGFDRASYGRAVYAHTTIVLETLRRVWGATRFDAAIHAWATRHRFEHPDPDALSVVFDEHYWPGFSQQVLRPALLEGAVSSPRLISIDVRAQGDRYVAEVRAARDGPLPLPTSIALYARGTELARIPWPPGDSRLHATWIGDVAPTDARIDPDDAILLDASDRDDVVRAAGTSVRESPLFARALFAMQALLAWCGP